MSLLLPLLLGLGGGLIQGFAGNEQNAQITQQQKNLQKAYQTNLSLLTNQYATQLLQQQTNIEQRTVQGNRELAAIRASLATGGLLQGATASQLQRASTESTNFDVGVLQKNISTLESNEKLVKQNLGIDYQNQTQALENQKVSGFKSFLGGFLRGFLIGV